MADPASNTVRGAITALADTPPLPRLKFKERKLPVRPGNNPEPKTDVEVELPDGKKLRERLLLLDVNRERIVSDAAYVAPAGYSIGFSNALLAADGSIAVDPHGNLRIAPRHEMTLTGDALGRLGKAGAEQAKLEARETAAALAAQHFAGMDIGTQVFGDRLDV